MGWAMRCRFVLAVVSCYYPAESLTRASYTIAHRLDTQPSLVLLVPPYTEQADQVEVIIVLCSLGLLPKVLLFAIADGDGH